MESDQRADWPSRLLTDTRVTQFWDDRKVLGNWAKERRCVSAATLQHVLELFPLLVPASGAIKKKMGLREPDTSSPADLLRDLFPGASMRVPLLKHAQ